MRLKIVHAGEPVLRETARLLTPQEILGEEIQRLIRDMHEAMRDAPGVGLAAPQIGQPLQLAVIEDREDLLKGYAAADLAERERRAVPFHVVINPVIAYASEEIKYFYEGCLSLPGFSAIVPRARTVRVEYLDDRAQSQFVQASGWYARILQHEIDHLQGALYIDRMRSRTFTTLENWTRLHKGKPIPQSEPAPDPPDPAKEV
jgi:peptide deformylase